jgi:uncharacterized protein (DUF2164 family)
MNGDREAKTKWVKFINAYWRTFDKAKTGDVKAMQTISEFASAGFGPAVFNRKRDFLKAA